MTEQELGGGRGGRLLRVGSLYHVWIEGGILHLPAELLHPLVVLTCGKPLHIVTTARGRALTFVRASDVIAEAPNLKEMVSAVAARFGCGL